MPWKGEGRRKVKENKEKKRKKGKKRKIGDKGGKGKVKVCTCKIVWWKRRKVQN